MQINFINEIEPAFEAYEIDLKTILEKTLSHLNQSMEVSVNVVMVDDETMQNYNRDYRDIDKTTDVLSFVDGETMDGLTHLGDLLISTGAVVRQAEEYGHSIRREFCFLVTHGYLHLLGYDHMTPDDEKEMFGLQNEILSGIAERL
ncbi:rRNA maturation RNase YbeY [Erysipelothrix urinaevulpis]|uniref:rRNA maturation RNase YbeY n=1 Tax=Erysipelothrix urinaevulpis TaxID=2683717 RepID=UPI001358F906|nr:rRNA maturation RNase YbeY [Erysipelothrix urinaevulpis]